MGHVAMGLQAAAGLQPHLIQPHFSTCSCLFPPLPIAAEEVLFLPLWFVLLTAWVMVHHLLRSSTISLPPGLCAASPSLPVLGLSMTTSTHLMHLKNSNNSKKNNKLPLDPIPFLALLPSQPKLEKEDMRSPPTFSPPVHSQSSLLPTTISFPLANPFSTLLPMQPKSQCSPL